MHDLLGKLIHIKKDLISFRGTEYLGKTN